MAEHVIVRRSLSACFAFLIAFIGLVHEVLGAELMPWAPGFFGPILWHVIGLFAITVGLALLADALGLRSVPVVPLAAAAAVLGLGAVILSAVGFGMFHFFALWVMISGLAILALRPRPATR